MEKVKQYQQAIIKILEDWLEVKTKDHTDIKNYLIADTERNHYQLLRMGWADESYVFNPLIHFDIIEGKIWLQVNNTDVDVAEDLVMAGIDRNDIVLGLQPPFVRPHTAYGVAS